MVGAADEYDDDEEYNDKEEEDCFQGDEKNNYEIPYSLDDVQTRLSCNICSLKTCDEAI